MLSFRLKRTIRLGLKSLWLHKLRSSLTMLGIIFGVCSVIAMLAIGEGASYEAQQQIKRLGSQNVIVRSVKPPQDDRPGAQTTYVVQYGLTYADAERIASTIPSVKVVAPARNIRKDVWHKTRRADAHVLGTVPWYPDVANVTVAEGRFLNTVDMHAHANVCVLGHGLVRRLFPHDPPLGRSLRVGTQYYRVVGTLAPRGEAAKATGAAAETSDLAVYIPLTTARSRFGEILRNRTSGNQGMERVQLHELTIQVRRLEDVPETVEMVRALLDRFHEKQDYEMIVPLELLRQAERTKRIFNLVLGSIAAISLLVGGIGIMNIMLATVTERTREIGIRRALGARRRDIVLQFLSETVLLSGGGGVLGLALGVAIPTLVTQFAGMATIITLWSLALAFFISGAVGLVFGIYPAYRAAQMDPIEALRHE